MVDSSTNSQEIQILAPSSYTERGYSSVLSVSNNKKFLAYCVGNLVVIRNLDSLNDCRLFTGHSAKTSAVSFSPSNVFVVSGDVQGNIKIWFLDDMKVKKEYNACIGGKVNGIAWTEDNTKLLVYGDGKQT
jgi:WD40 repeat protein